MPAYEITRSVPILEATAELMIENAETANIILNGNLLQKDINYTILENGMVQFNIPLEESDSLVLKHTTKSAFPLLSKSNPKTPYRLYDTAAYLAVNAEYTVKLNINDQEFVNKFTSKLSPLYLSNPLGVLKNDIGEFAEDFKDKDLVFAVHLASKDFDQKLIIAEYTEALADANLLLREKWVRYKAILDLLTRLFLARTTDAGRREKKIGNLEIAVETKSPKLAEMLRRFQSAFDEVDGVIGTTILGNSMFATFTKAGSTAYPLDNRLW